MATTLSIFLLSYFLHSSVFLSTAWLLDVLGALKNPRFAEFVWRMALFGGLITVSLEMGFYSTQSTNAPFLTSPSSLIIAQVDTQNAPLVLDRSFKKVEAEKPRESLDDVTIGDAGQYKDNSSSSQKMMITLPAGWRVPAFWLVSLWSIYAFFIIVQMLFSVRRLNVLASTFPAISECDRFRFIDLLNAHSSIETNLRISGQWNSPVVMPNGTICLPRWAFTELSESQQRAMLAHELAHLKRRDPVWNLATQLILRVCFFQVLNRVAIRQLSLLCEVACDAAAVGKTGRATDLAHALYVCAEKKVGQQAPLLSLPMAGKASHLYLRIELLLDEESMNIHFAKSTVATLLAKISAFVISAGALAIAMPTIAMNKHAASSSIVSKAFGPSVKASFSAKNEDVVHVDSVAKKVVFDQISAPSTVKQKAAVADADADADVDGDLRNQAEIRKSAPIEMEVEKNDLLIKAKAYFTEKNYLAAAQIYLELANAGNIEAQTLLGEMLWYGDGVTSDQAKAEMWFKKAALGGNVTAQKFLDLFREREKRQKEINYFMIDYDAKNIIALDANCSRLMKYSEVMVWARCYDEVSTKIDAAFALASVVPATILNIMTSHELQRTKSHLAELQQKTQKERREKLDMIVSFQTMVFRGANWNGNHEFARPNFQDEAFRSRAGAATLER